MSELSLTITQAENIAKSLNLNGGKFAVVDAETIMRLNDQKATLRSRVKELEEALREIDTLSMFESKNWNKHHDIARRALQTEQKEKK